MGTFDELRKNLSSIQQREQVARSNMVSGYRFDAPAQAAPFLPHVRAAEQKYGIPENLLSRLIHQESRWNPKAVSPELISMPLLPRNKDVGVTARPRGEVTLRRASGPACCDDVSTAVQGSFWLVTLCFFAVNSSRRVFPVATR